MARSGWPNHQEHPYAWNAVREDKTLTSVKYDTGFYAVAA